MPAPFATRTVTDAGSWATAAVVEDPGAVVVVPLPSLIVVVPESTDSNDGLSVARRRTTPMTTAAMISAIPRAIAPPADRPKEPSSAACCPRFTAPRVRRTGPRTAPGGARLDCGDDA